MVRALFCVLIFGGVSPLTAQEPADPETMIPLTIGNRWTYRVNGKDKLVVTAVRHERVGDVLCTRMEARSRGDSSSSEHIAFNGEGWLRYREDGFDVEPPINFGKLPLKKGDVWKSAYKVGGKTGAIRYEADVDVVTVPAGKYNAWLIRAEGGEDKNKVKISSWYAPKVGLIKQTIEDGKMAWTLELELEKFDNAEGKK